jgi:hypothetical protein
LFRQKLAIITVKIAVITIVHNSNLSQNRRIFRQICISAKICIFNNPKVVPAVTFVSLLVQPVLRRGGEPPLADGADERLEAGVDPAMLLGPIQLITFASNDGKKCYQDPILRLRFTTTALQLFCNATGSIAHF